MTKPLYLIVIFATILNSDTIMTYSGGSGTPSAPYQIANKADWLTIRTTDYDASFILTADIDLARIHSPLPSLLLIPQTAIRPLMA